jgi:hypothetical protein
MMPKHFFRSVTDIKDFVMASKTTQIGIALFSLFSIVYITSKMSETSKVIYRDYQKPNFSEGRILGSQTSTYLKSKEVQLNKAARRIMAENKSLKDRMVLLEKRMEAKS